MSACHDVHLVLVLVFLNFGEYFAFSLDDYLQVLEKEVNIDFCRSMNRIIFDKTVDDDPETFAFVTKPELKLEVTPERGTCEREGHLGSDSFDNGKSG